MGCKKPIVVRVPKRANLLVCRSQNQHHVVHHSPKQSHGNNVTKLHNPKPPPAVRSLSLKFPRTPHALLPSTPPPPPHKHTQSSHFPSTTFKIWRRGGGGGGEAGRTPSVVFGSARIIVVFTFATCQADPPCLQVRDALGGHILLFTAST